MILVQDLVSIPSELLLCKAFCQSISLVVQHLVILSQLLYSDDLPNPLILDEVLHRWKLRWLEISRQGRPETLSDALKQCSPKHLPNINTLLKLFATLPLSSCSCERSASALRRLNNYLRTTQTAERLSALALVHIAYETEINLVNYT